MSKKDEVPVFLELTSYWERQTINKKPVKEQDRITLANVLMEVNE